VQRRNYAGPETTKEGGSVGPGTIMPDLFGSGHTVLGVWDAINGRLQDTGQVVVDVTDNTEQWLATTTTVSDVLITLKDRVDELPPAFDATAAAAGSFFDKVVVGKEQTKSWITGVRSAFESNFAGMFQHFDEGWRAATGSMVMGFLQALEQMGAAALAKRLGSLIFGSTNEDGSSGGGGILGKVFGWLFGAALGGATGGGHTNNAATGANSGRFGSFFNFGAVAAGHRASGGAVAAGLLYRVNDDAGRNTEYFQPNTSGEVLTLGQALRRTRGGGGGDVHIHNHFPVTRSMADAHPQALRTIARHATASLRRGLRQGGYDNE
jgi:hypothetical protein